MADDLINGGADRFGEPVIVQRCGDRLLNLYDVIVANPVDLGGGHPHLNQWLDHLQNVGGETSGHAQALDFFLSFGCYWHENIVLG